MSKRDGRGKRGFYQLVLHRSIETHFILKIAHNLLVHSLKNPPTSLE